MCDQVEGKIKEFARRQFDGQEKGRLRSLSGKGISLCRLCDALCLCGEITNKNMHHRGTEVTQRTTETDFFDRLQIRLAADTNMSDATHSTLSNRRACSTFGLDLV